MFVTKIEKNDLDFLIAAENGFITSLKLKNEILNF